MGVEQKKTECVHGRFQDVCSFSPQGYHKVWHICMNIAAFTELFSSIRRIFNEILISECPSSAIVSSLRVDHTEMLHTQQDAICKVYYLL
jgi:hypothetical protein